MSHGDIVVWLANPTRYGFGIIETSLRDGRLQVRFEDDEQTTLPFHALELELADKWVAQPTLEAA